MDKTGNLQRLERCRAQALAGAELLMHGHSCRGTVRATQHAKHDPACREHALAATRSRDISAFEWGRPRGEVLGGAISTLLPAAPRSLGRHIGANFAPARSAQHGRAAWAPLGTLQAPGSRPRRPHAALNALGTHARRPATAVRMSMPAARRAAPARDRRRDWVRCVQRAGVARVRRRGAAWAAA